MSSEKLDGIRSILESGDFAALIGSVEDEWFEAKAEPYQLGTERQKLELAKDVSALANDQGGVIVLGLRTKKTQTHLGDEVEEISPFKEELIAVAQYQDILSGWIYPSVIADIRWYRSNEDAERGLTAIWVHEYAEAEKPFLTLKTSFETPANQITGILCGYFVRAFGRVASRSAQEIHALMKSGLTNRYYQDIQETLAKMLRNQEDRTEAIRATTRTEQLSARITNLIRLSQGEAGPSYVLAIIPEETVEIPSLFREPYNPVVQLLRNPPELRPHGFGVFTGADPEISAGQLRRAVNAGRALELWKDSTLVFAASAGSDFLCWHSREDRPLKINQIALIESVHDFLSLSKRVHGEFAEPRALKYRFRLVLESLPMSPPPRLNPGRLELIEDDFHAKNAPADHVQFDLSWEGEINPGVLGFQMVKQVYNWFSIEDAWIPYKSAHGEGSYQISEEAIRSIDLRTTR